MKSKGANFTISNYPLEQTEFLYEQKQGTSSNFNNPSITCTYCQFVQHVFELDLKGREKLGKERNTVFDYSKFNDRIDTQSNFVVSK